MENSFGVALCFVGMRLTSGVAFASETTLQSFEDKLRLIVARDGEVDNMNSLIHTLLYANEFDLEGIVQTSSSLH